MNQVQEKELNIYSSIAKVCDKYNLRYFAIGGTCIGAVRHNGFIPWDDDIDIAMPREDYELFRTNYYKELPDYLKKLDYDNSKQYPHAWIKIHDLRTTYVEKEVKDLYERYTGAFVDIMPIDGVPRKRRKRERYIKYLSILVSFNQISKPISDSCYCENHHISRGEYVIGKIMTFIYKGIDYSVKIRKLSQCVDFDTSEMCIFTWRAGIRKRSMERVIFPKEWFDEIIEVPFENTTMKIPARYDEYLKRDFGDYMTLPPKELQLSNHNIYVNNMNTPVEYYIERDRRKNKQYCQ